MTKPANQGHDACNAAILGSAERLYHAILLLSSDGFSEPTSLSPSVTLHVYNESRKHVVSE